jgi:predicted DsbA family dithiol-disulfide isomerase
VPEPVKVDVWSDIACPWCYIGKRNLETGVAAFSAGSGSVPVEVEFHSYQLAPDTEADHAGSELEYVASHYGKSLAEVEVMFDRVRSAAASAGVTLDFETVQHANTAKAHQLLHLAKAHGLQLEMADRIFRAHFSEGTWVGDDDALADLAAEVGLDRAEVIDALAAGTYAAAVEADKALGARYGIRGVPFFVVDGKYGLSGAQPPDTFEQVLAQVVEERASVS